MRPALLALALLLAACAEDDPTTDAPEETTTSVDLSGPAPLPTVPTTAATTTAPPTTLAPATTKAPVTTRPPLPPTTAPPPTQASTYYANCDAVRAAGAAPLHRGEPGYRPGLDRDNDGIACDTEG